MNKSDILNTLTPELVDKFRTAIEIGKWADGKKLTDEQRKICMQSVLVWENENLSEEERTGYIHKPKKDACGGDLEKTDTAENEPSIINFNESKSIH